VAKMPVNSAVTNASSFFISSLLSSDFFAYHASIIILSERLNRFNDVLDEIPDRVLRHVRRG